MPYQINVLFKRLINIVTYYEISNTHVRSRITEYKWLYSVYGPTSNPWYDRALWRQRKKHPKFASFQLSLQVVL